MSLMHRALPLPIHAPLPPDRWLCKGHIGARPLIPLDCQTAIDTNWADGHTPIHYFLQDPRPSYGEWIPNYSYWGNCRVALETAGPPSHLPHTVVLRPQEIRGLAAYLVQKCTVENNGMGGFMTLGITGALSFIHNPTNETCGGNFLTISVRPRLDLGRGDDEGWGKEPGSHDASIAAILSSHAASLGIAVGVPGQRWKYDSIASDLRARALEMRGRYNPDLTWWSKNGYFSWWAKQYDPFSRPETAFRNRTANSDEFLGDPTIEGERARNVTSSAGSVPSFSPEKDSEDGGGGGGGEGETQAQSEAGSLSTNPREGEDEEGDADGKSESSPHTPIGGGGAREAHGDTDVGDMTYQCDDALGGSPDPMDCEKLSWSGLKPPDSIETLKPGVPTFYSQGTCALGISSMTPKTIAWAHLIAAFETLNMLCVQNPIKRVKGGRAYFGKQMVSSWINGKTKRDSTTDEIVSATEALPQGINATLFRHDAKSKMACEWTLAEEGKNVSSCRVD